jgi:hypothetical protein
VGRLISDDLPGGIYAEIGDDDCTHLVVDDQQIPELSKDLVLPHFVVRAEVIRNFEST